jgi:hypothetical protein
VKKEETDEEDTTKDMDKDEEDTAKDEASVAHEEAFHRNQ